MKGAAEASVQRHREGVASDALSMVELPAGGDHAAPHVVSHLLTHETFVGAWNSNKSLSSVTYKI